MTYSTGAAARDIGVEEIALGPAAMLCDAAGCLYWPAENCLIVADLHLEKGSSFARRGHFLPPYDTAATLALLEQRIDYWQPARVIALGDSFHDSGGACRLGNRDRERLASLMLGREWLWLAGNHDPVPPTVGGDFAEEMAIAGIMLRHAPAPGESSLEITGHLHPQARLVQRGKLLRRKCFASDGTRLILPAFGAYTGGLSLRAQAFAGLFDRARLRAHLISGQRVYTIAYSMLV